MIQDEPAIFEASPPLVTASDAHSERANPQSPVTSERADGTLVIDLKTLLPAPAEEQCADIDPNPLDNAIVVFRRTATDQRLRSTYGPINEPDDFGSAIPRARVKVSDNAAAEANAINNGVGGFNANGGEVRVKIDF